VIVLYYVLLFLFIKLLVYQELNLGLKARNIHLSYISSCSGWKLSPVGLKSWLTTKKYLMSATHVQ